ncbi:cupredoxin domain-containing protein [Aestuariivirga sp.]|uniref:cupredoxin domain-containing protein n=1 Tax=Aestuariivirga sp. TaxID=2650926 RepID=UPI0039E5D424
MKTEASSTSTIVNWLLLSSFILTVAGAFAFYAASQRPPLSNEESQPAYQVTITQTSCEPNILHAPTGEIQFDILNASDRVVEWEILSGVMVLEERENITPGLRSRLSARLEPGTYEMTCGLLSNPRGKLIISGSSNVAPSHQKVDPKNLIGSLAEYKVYELMQIGAMQSAVERLDAALSAGDHVAATETYTLARLSYRRIEPQMVLYGDLKERIAPLPDYLKDRENDRAYVGLYRIGYGLLKNENSTNIRQLLVQLQKDLLQLKTQVRATKLLPADILRLTEQHARRMAETILVDNGGVDLNELAELMASWDGLQKPLNLFVPALIGYDKVQLEKLENARARLNDELATLPGDGQSSASKRQKLSALFMELAAAISPVKGVLTFGN